MKEFSYKGARYRAEQQGEAFHVEIHVHNRGWQVVKEVDRGLRKAASKALGPATVVVDGSEPQKAVGS